MHITKLLFLYYQGVVGETTEVRLLVLVVNDGTGVPPLVKVDVIGFEVT